MFSISITYQCKELIKLVHLIGTTGAEVGLGLVRLLTQQIYFGAELNNFGALVRYFFLQLSILPLEVNEVGSNV